MSARNPQGTRKPSAEHVEHAKTRSSVNNNRDSHISTPRAPNHGIPDLNQKPVGTSSNQHAANLGIGRRRASVPDWDPSTTHEIRAARTHKAPGNDKLAADGFARKMDIPRNNRIPIPERSELRIHRRSIDAARPKPAPPRDEPKVTFAEDQPKPKTIAAYEPGYVLRRNAEYFDVNQDGIIGLRDTYAGCRKLGTPVD